MACNTCKKKNKEITNLNQITTDYTGVKEAYDYLQIASQLNSEKWDYIISIYRQHYPAAQIVNKGCKDCLKTVARAITHLYHQSLANQK